MGLFFGLAKGEFSIRRLWTWSPGIHLPEMEGPGLKPGAGPPSVYNKGAPSPLIFSSYLPSSGALSKWHLNSA